jgi:hypothetical protein
MQNYSRHDIKTSLSRAIKQEHKALRDLLFWLGLYDAKALFLEDGYSSIYNALTTGHGYSEGAAMRRIKTSRLARRHPEILEFIEAGDLTLTVLGLICESRLADTEMKEAFKDLKRSSKKRAEEYLARRHLIAANTKAREVIKPLGVKKAFDLNSPKALQGSILSAIASVGGLPAPVGFGKEVAGETKQDAKQDAEQDTPQDPEQAAKQPEALVYKLILELDEESLNALKRAGDVAGSKSMAETISRVTEFFLSKKDLARMESPPKREPRIDAKNSAGGGKSCNNVQSSPLLPPRSVGLPSSRYISHSTRRELLKAYQGRCGFVSRTTGHRCTQVRNLEVEHIAPFAKGGGHEVSNLMILCKQHNLMRAREQYGELLIASKIESSLNG